MTPILRMQQLLFLNAIYILNLREIPSKCYHNILQVKEKNHLHKNSFCVDDLKQIWDITWKLNNHDQSKNTHKISLREKGSNGSYYSCIQHAYSTLTSPADTTQLSGIKHTIFHFQTLERERDNWTTKALRASIIVNHMHFWLELYLYNASLSLKRILEISSNEIWWIVWDFRVMEKLAISTTGLCLNQTY